METSWLIMAALALAAGVFGILMVRAQGANGFIRSELETARKELAEMRETMEAKEGELGAAREEAARLTRAAARNAGTAPHASPGEKGSSAADESSEKAQSIMRSVEPAAPDQEVSAGADEPGQAPRTMLFRPPAEIEPEDSTAGMPYLKIKGGGQDELCFLEFDKMSAGRDKGADIVIDDVAASRSHFEIVYKDHRFMLKDNLSTNGTFCNGARIDEAWLEFGDVIRVGETEMTFSCDGYDLRDSDPSKAVESLEACVRKQPEFVPALKILAFLLERDVGRKDEAAPLWDTLARLENK